MTKHTSKGPGAPQPQAKAPPATMTRPFEFSDSVGRGGKNKPDDVKAVQAALNRRSKAGLVIDGLCGPKTLAAIISFQERLGQVTPDGLVEVGGDTARALASVAPLGPPSSPPQAVD